MSLYVFYDCPRSNRRIAYNSTGDQAGFMAKALIDDEAVRVKVCSDRGFPCLEWKAGTIYGEHKYLPVEIMSEELYRRSQEINYLKNRLTVANIQSEKIILDAVRYRYLREVIGADESGIFIPCGNSRVFPKVTDAAIDSLIARRVG